MSSPNPRARSQRVFFSILIFVAGLLLGACALALVSAGEIYDYQDTVDGVHLPRVDAIVCLAGGRGRIAGAGDIWYRYWELSQQPLKAAGRNPTPAKPPILYLSGMGPQANWNVLAKQVRRGVLTSLTPDNVVIENESINTEDNARWLVRYAVERGWESILLVTSRYHMLRSKWIFEKVLARAGLPMRIETLSVYQEPFEPSEWRSSYSGVRVTLWEYIKWLYYVSIWRPESESGSTI